MWLRWHVCRSANSLFSQRPNVLTVVICGADILNAIFSTGAAVALIATLFLDNTVPGTDRERGLHMWCVFISRHNMKLFQRRARRLLAPRHATYGTACPTLHSVGTHKSASADVLDTIQSAECCTLQDKAA